MAASWAGEPFLALDCESTGLDPFTDRIVEVAAVEIGADGSAGPSWSAIVNPGVDIPDAAAAVHGITTERARSEGVEPARALTVLAERIFEHGHRPLVAFNARYDWPLLLSEAERHGIEFPCFAPILDPWLIDRLCDRYRPGGRRLVQVCGHYDVPLNDTEAHGALADAVAAGRVMRKLIEAFPKIGEHTLAGVWLRQVRGHETDRQRLVDHMRRNRDPDFDSPAGWPIPAYGEPKPGGSPVEVSAGASGPAETDTAHIKRGGGDPATGTVEASPGGSPSPPPGEADTDQPLSVRDVAMLAGKAFRAAYDAAPKGHKTRIVDRLRHALVYATWAKHSFNELTPHQLAAVAGWLTHIRDGQVTYQTTARGVTFRLGDTETTVDWADIDQGAAA